MLEGGGVARRRFLSFTSLILRNRASRSSCGVYQRLWAASFYVCRCPCGLQAMLSEPCGYPIFAAHAEDTQQLCCLLHSKAAVLLCFKCCSVLFFFNGLTDSGDRASRQCPGRQGDAGLWCSDTPEFCDQAHTANTCCLGFARH